MVKSQYLMIKKALLGDEYERNANLFERAKVELIFNLALLYTVVYFAGFIKVIWFGYWYIFFIRVVGVFLLFGLFYALRRTKHYKVPSMIWVVSFIILGIQALILNNGHLSFANLGFALLNMAIAALMLQKLMKIVIFLYYTIFISISLSITFQLLEPLHIGVNFSHDQIFLESNIIFAVVPFFLLIYVLYIFVTYEYRVNKLLEVQIDRVVTQEKQIKKANTAMYKSIQFASKIQDAFLPNLEIYNAFYNSHFLLMRPQNQLSGDFYWVASDENNLYLAVVDSSENNITGAIVSSIYFDALDTAVKKEKLQSTQDIICFLNKHCKEKMGIEDIKDKMHISLVRIDNAQQKLYFSSEKNNVYFARKGKKVIESYKPHVVVEKDDFTVFNEVQINYQMGDKLYLASDGFAWQFKGFDNSKFKESVFKAYLTNIKNEPMPIQKRLLTNKLETWLNGDLQTDDICIIGIEL